MHVCDLILGNIRVCNYCYKIVKAYVVDDLDKSLEALKADIKICFDDVNNSEPFGGVGNSLTSSRTSLSSYHTRDESGIRRMGSSNSLPGIIERELRTQTSVARNPFDAFGVTPKEANDIKQVPFFLSTFCSDLDVNLIKLTKFSKHHVY